jgi:hypothetical protein
MVGRRLPGGFSDNWHIQAAADDLSGLAKRNALFGDPVIPGSRRALLKGQPKVRCHIESVHRGPAVEPLAHTGQDTLFASYIDQVSDEALLDLIYSIVDRRGKPHHRCADSMRSHSLQTWMRHPKSRERCHIPTAISVALVIHSPIFAA